MKYLQKLGKAIMLPVACLPLCGILMGVGYLLCPASMQGGEMTGALPMIGMFLVKAGGALIDNIAVLFAVGVGVGMADERDGTPAIAALASWLMITTLLKPDNVKPILEMFSTSEAALLAFAKIENPFIGILSGLIGAWSFNRFKDTSLPEYRVGACVSCCLRSFDGHMADTVRGADRAGALDRRNGNGRGRNLCFFEQAADPGRITSRAE